MPWEITVADTGGGTGGGMAIHGPEYHTPLIPTVVNPNLLYNSTGMMNMIGWIVHPTVINYRDEFIIDDYSYFLATGNSEDPNGMISASIPLSPTKTYTFSGLFEAPSPVRISMLFQDAAHINLIDEFVGTVVLFEGILGVGSDRKIVQFTPPAGTVAGSLKIEFLAAGPTEQAIYKRLKIEEGNVATAWIPCLTDPYQNNIMIAGLTAADMA